MTQKKLEISDTDAADASLNRRFRNVDLDLLIALAISFTAFALAMTSAFASPITQAVLGLMFIAFIPGYLLIAALFPGKQDIGNFERVGLSVGLSFAIVALLGLALGYSSWGFWIGPMVASLTALIILLTFIALVRRHALPYETRFSIDLGKPIRSLRTALFSEQEDRSNKALSFVLVGAVLTSAVLLGYAISVTKQGESFTELYILGPDGTANNYPTALKMGAPNPVTVSVVNHEKKETTYNLVIALNDSRQSRSLYSHQLNLNDNETWKNTVSVTPDRVGGNQKLEILLYVDGNTSSPYLENHLWVNVTRG